MHQIGSFNPAERSRQKQAARERDDARLRNGEISADALRREVGLFAGLDLTRSRVIRRRARVAA